jgi:LPXTG-motif cell wall-anchored protein
MSSRTIVAAALGAALVLGSVTTVAAQTLDKRTYFTFSSNVTIPGVTLPAGKYIFRFVDANQAFMQVVSEDGRQSYAIFLTRQARRADVPNDPEVRFMETAAGMPRAIQTWWYPGQTIGWELVYPKEQARLLAKGTQRPVLTTVEAAPASKPAELALVSPTGEETKVAEAPAPVVPSGPTEVGQLAPPSLAIQAEGQQARAALPKTASNLPLVALAGLMMLLGAAVLRARRTRESQ